MLKSGVLRVLGVAALLLGAVAGVRGQSASVVGPGARVVLVLPFDNRSGQPNLNWISDSFPDTLNQRLTSAGFLTISRDDRRFALDHLGLPEDFRPTRATTIRIAQTLNAAYVIVGSFNVEANKIQVQAQVLDVEQLRLSGALQDEADLPQLFNAENAISWKICRQINPTFSVAEQTFLSASSGIQLLSFENYIRGLGAQTPEERVKRLQAAVDASPSYTAALLALGKELYVDRNFDRAAAVLAKVPHNDRLALEANFYIGLARFNSAKYAEAEAAFGFVASRMPLPEVVNDQAVAQTRQNKDGGVLFQRASAADPNEEDYHYNLAITYYHRGDIPNAQLEIDQALKLKTADGEATELKGLIASGRPATRGAVAFEPTTRLRRTYSEAGFRQATFALDQMKAIKLATLPPSQQSAEYNQMGREYLAQGLLPEAEQEFHSALLADPNGSQAHAGLAQVREQSGDAVEARTEAEASIRLAPNVNAYLVLARLDLQSNALAASAANVGNALRLEPTNPAALGMRSALQSRGQAVP